MASLQTRRLMTLDPDLRARIVLATYMVVVTLLLVPDPGEDAETADRVAWAQKRDYARFVRQDLRSFNYLIDSPDSSSQVLPQLFDLAFWPECTLADTWELNGGVAGGAAAISDEDLIAALTALWDATNGGF